MGVITNILKGVLEIDRSDISYLVPELEYDETDLSVMRPVQFSNWTIVKQKCEEGSVIRDFFEGIDDERFMVIHIDTAERFEIGYDVNIPAKSSTANDIHQVRDNVVNKLKSWLGGNMNERITFAAAVEETEGWLLTIAENKPETGLLTNPKERFDRLLQRSLRDKDKKRIFQMDAFDQGYEKSRIFRKPKDLNLCRTRNKSLDLFCGELESL